MLEKSVEEIMKHIRTRIVGQSEALEELRLVLTVAAADISDPGKPLGIFFFAGPTRVGKSETGVALAEAIHGDGSILCRVHCNQLQDQYSVSSIFGAPPGYVGFAEQATMIDDEKVQGRTGRPGILIFEEIEKAHPDVLQSMLGMFDRGKLSMNSGTKEISLKNTIVIMTSNIGARKLRDEAASRQIGFSKNGQKNIESELYIANDQSRRLVLKEMRRLFSPEFISRIDKTVVFHWISSSDAELILQRIAFDFGGRLLKSGHYLFIEPSVIQQITRISFNQLYGAQPLKQEFRKMVELPIAQKIVSLGAGCYDFLLSTEKDEIIINAVYDKKRSIEKAKREALEKDRVTAIVNAAAHFGNEAPYDVNEKLETCVLRVAGRRLDLRLPSRAMPIYNAWSKIFEFSQVSAKIKTLSPERLVRILSLIANIYNYSGANQEALEKINSSVKAKIFFNADLAVVDNHYRQGFTKDLIDTLKMHTTPKS